MRKVVVLLLVILFVWQIALATVSVQVCGPDGETPFDFRDIMVGQKLTLTLISDSNDLWSGALFIEGDDRALGSLGAKDSDPNTRDCDESHYSAAGDHAVVFKWIDSVIWGYDMYASDVNCLPGNWFTIDYYAEQPGDCQIDFYDYNTDWDDPNLSLNFTHKPSCDFNQDGSVDVNDFSQLSACWLIPDCNDVNDCVPVDLNSDGFIDLIDMAMFAEFWLWDGSITESEPNTAPLLDPTPDPNVIYSIVDLNELDEIYLDTNESITFYVDLTTTDQNDLMAFDIEVHISEPNLGSIDNTASPNGTAEILATPRLNLLDLWGPGILQETGIKLSAFSFEYSINDGHLASFVYTANATGDVILNIVNVSSGNMENNVIYPFVKSILIHQIDPEIQGDSPESMMMTFPVLETETQSLPEPDMSETIDFLEMIWQDDKDLRKSIDKSEWEQFIDALKSTQEQLY